MKTLNFLLAAFGLTALVSCSQPAPEAQQEEKNTVVENIMTRRSIRKYQERPVNRDTMEVILTCGINAPNAINKQAWEVRVVDDPAVMNEIQEMMVAANPDHKPEMVTGCFRGAPTMVFIANDTTFAYSPVDCGLLSQNIMLSAWSMGVGSVCLGSPVRFLQNSPQAIEKLGFSEGYAPLVCIGLGYPDETPDAKPRDRSKVRFVE